MWSVGVFEAARWKYVSANTSFAFLSQPCPVSVDVISRTVLITSTGRTKGDGRMPASIASRYRLASPSATGHAVMPMCSTNCAFPRTQGGTDCVSLPTGYHDEAPFLSHIGEIMDPLRTVFAPRTAGPPRSGRSSTRAPTSALLPRC